MKDAEILAVRAVGGAQKLFGVFGGPGLRRTAGVMERLGLRPGHLWGGTAALDLSSSSSSGSSLTPSSSSSRATLRMTSSLMMSCFRRSSLLSGV